jgi:hypothetical protein
MDPYLEHPVLWESVQARLVVAIAEQLQPRIDPRYVTSIEKRVFNEGSERRIPGVWIQRTHRDEEVAPAARLDSDSAVIVEIEDLEIHQMRVEILDSYNELKLVALIEIVSPTNKAVGPGRRSYQAKQEETLARECHLVEIDLLRHGQHVLAVPEWRVEELKPFESLCCVNRWTRRNRFELYPRKLADRLPRINIPLEDDDPDVVLDLQAALEHVYLIGRYARRIRYQEPCDAPLSPSVQAWARERVAASQSARADANAT